MTRILAIDLGKFKSVACIYSGESAEAKYQAVETTPGAMHDLLVEVCPDRVVIEVCGISGWMHDLAESLELAIEVVDPRHEAWRWSKVKRKTDRADALKLARLSAMNQVHTVHMPSKTVRQWRSLINYRHTLVDRRTAMKNTIRALLDVQGIRMSIGARGWTSVSMDRLKELARPVTSVSGEDLWRGQLHSELQALSDVDRLRRGIDDRLNEIATADKRVSRLKTIPGVGNRLAEMVVSAIDDPSRFRSAREVGAYAGLVPRQFESGTMSRTGRITRQGPGLLRRLLVQIAWGMERRSERVAALFERLAGNHRTRRKKAVVAVARRLFIWCWAMLRDGTSWREAVPA